MIHVEIQHATERQGIPEDEKFPQWASAAVKRDRAELVIRIVDETESAELNEHYRHKAGPTNVLSFPFEVPKGIPNDLLGDLVICAAVVEREAREQGKNPEAHWAHMVVHGVLHLQGYDHISESDAAVMEAEEIAILDRLGFPNPYEETMPS
ncbi:rRNA maturation RNase YbeY [Methylocaldum sp. MU1018]